MPERKRKQRKKKPTTLGLVANMSRNVALGQIVAALLEKIHHPAAAAVTLIILIPQVLVMVA